MPTTRFILMRDDDDALQEEVVLSKITDFGGIQVLARSRGVMFVAADASRLSDLAPSLHGWMIEPERVVARPEPRLRVERAPRRQAH